MKREILFRGKSADNGVWVYGGYFRHINRQLCPIGDKLKDDDVSHLILESGFADWNMPKPIITHEVIPETIGQFTGLTDKKGVKIFSDDVLQWTSCNPFSLGETRKVVVNYVNGWYFCIGSISVSLAELLVTERCEVIGNIHDNPKLLK